MTQLADLWAEQFGLASTPLFEAGEALEPAAHRVLLDGGLGTFAFSESEEEIWRFENVAAWAWSGDIPHHVTVTPKQVAVARWDNTVSGSARAALDDRVWVSAAAKLLSCFPPRVSRSAPPSERQLAVKAAAQTESDDRQRAPP